MDINAYIASGVLENYVMGLASEQERLEVQCMSKIYPEIAEELHALESALENYAVQNAIAPPAQIKGKLWSALDAGEPSVEQITESKPRRIFINAKNGYLAALAAISIGAIGLAVILLMRGQQARQELNLSLDRQASMQQQLDSNQSALNEIARELSLVRNPAFRPVRLQGTEAKAPQATMTVYWNVQSQEVYIGGVNLPAAPADKQYQLWAIRDGQPVDLGVFDVQSALLSMKRIDQAQAFAVTLEPRGGQAQPTLSEMYVIGNT